MLRTDIVVCDGISALVLGAMAGKQCLGIMLGYSAQDMLCSFCHHAPWDHCAEHRVQGKELDGLKEVVSEPNQAEVKAQVQSETKVTVQEEAAQAKAEAKAKVDAEGQVKPAGCAPQQLVRERSDKNFQARIGKGAHRQLASHLHQQWREGR